MAPSSQAMKKLVPMEPQPDLGPEPGRGNKLQSWQWLVFSLCFYGFMAQMRPGESFTTPYLLGSDKNFTKEQITNEIMPVLSYSYLAVLVPIFLLTDYLRYKPVLLLQGLCYIAVWLLLLFGHSVLHMQFMEFFYSITMASRIAYSSYIFSLVRPAQYQRMAGYSRTAVLLGVFTSSVLGQLLVTVGRVSFTVLNYISLAFLTFSLVLTIFLKRPKRSLFFNRIEPAHGGASPSELDQMHPGPGQFTGKKLSRTLLVGWWDCILVRMLRELKDSLRLPQLRLWSLWWIFNSAGYYLIVFYVHILWNVVDPTKDTTRIYNGGTDAASTLLGAITSFAAGFVKIRWALWAKLIIGGVTAVQGGLVFLMYSTSSIWQCYMAFVLFRGFYQFLVPIAIFQIASSLSKELCALVFGINTFLATVLKTIITLIVSDKRGLGLLVRSQPGPAPAVRIAEIPPGPRLWSPTTPVRMVVSVPVDVPPDHRVAPSPRDATPLAFVRRARGTFNFSDHLLLAPLLSENRLCMMSPSPNLQTCFRPVWAPVVNRLSSVLVSGSEVQVVTYSDPPSTD